MMSMYHIKDNITSIRNSAPKWVHFVGFDGRSQGSDLVSSMPRSVCRKVKEMSPFSASRE